MRRIFLVLFLILLLTNTQIIQAQDPEPPYQYYLPLLYKQETIVSSPWLGPVGGPVVVLLPHPANKDILYAGTWGAGVFVSKDAGNSWQPKNVGLNNFYINSMAIDPINPRILYAGTYRDKLYKSTDAGETWYQSSAGIQKDAIVYAITIDPNNADILFIATRGENSTGAPPWKGVVYRSTNEGIDWTPVIQNVSRLDEPIQDWAYDLIVNPKNSQIVFAAFHESGIYKSINGGTSWFTANTGIGGDDGIISARGLSINPVNTTSNALYMGVWHRLGTYKSTNNADSWTNTPLDVKVYNMDLDNVSPNVLYLANFDPGNFKGGIYKTSNSAASWSLAGLNSEIMYTVAVNQNNHNQVFAGTLANGIYRSDNGGSNWALINQGLFNTNVSGMLALPWDGNTLIGATASNGVSVSSDYGKTWQPMNAGLGDKVTTGLILNPANNNQLFVLTSSGGLFKCTLPGCNWSAANSGLPTASIDPSLRLAAILDENQRMEYELAGGNVADDLDTKATTYKSLTSMVFASSNPNIVYLATKDGGLFQSTNNGANWTSAGLTSITVNSVAVSPLNADKIYAATLDSGIIKYSINAGASWQNQTLPVGITNSLSISPANPGSLYAGTDNGVYSSVNDGVWTQLGLAGQNVTGIAAHPTQSGILIAGTNQGAYFSTNNGQSWNFLSVELTNKTIRTIQFAPNNSKKVYLGTSTMGTYLFYLP